MSVRALDLLLRGLVNPGDEVIIVEPCYVSYEPNIRMVYGVPVVVSARSENGYQVDPEDIRRVITSKTKAILLNYPANPTGATIAPEVLARIGELAVEHDFAVISDEIYSAIIYEGEHKSIISVPGLIRTDHPS